MANTINVNQIEWDGTRGSLHYVLSSDGTAISDTVLLDISTLAPAPAAIKIRKMDLAMYGNFILTFDWDATTDIEAEIFEVQQEGVATSLMQQQFVRDFTDGPRGGKAPTAGNKAAAGFTGDLLVTSSGLASGDGFSLYLSFQTD